jgi:hypothetical protein
VEGLLSSILQGGKPSFNIKTYIFNLINGFSDTKFQRILPYHDETTLPYSIGKYIFNVSSRKTEKAGCTERERVLSKHRIGLILQVMAIQLNC